MGGSQLRFLILIIISFLSFVGAEVYLKGVGGKQGSLIGEKKIFDYGDLTISGIPVKAEALSISFSGNRLVDLVSEKGTIIFQDKNSLGIKDRGKVFLFKLLPDNKVLRYTIDEKFLR